MLGNGVSKKRAKSALGITLLFFATSITAAGDFSLDWWTIDGGGEMFTTGGDFQLSGTIGQPDAGPVMTGGDFELAGGFWPDFCFGDLDGDDLIGLSDLAQLLSNYGMTVGAQYEDGDIEPPNGGDGDVDLADLAELLSVYGDPCP